MDKPPISPNVFSPGDKTIQQQVLPRPSSKTFTRPRPTKYSSYSSYTNSVPASPPKDTWLATSIVSREGRISPDPPTVGSGLVHVPQEHFPLHKRRMGDAADLVDLFMKRCACIIAGAGCSVALADGPENKRLVTWRGFLEVLAETVQRLLNLSEEWLEEIRLHLSHAAAGPTPGPDLQIVAEMIAERCSPEDPFMRYTHLVFKILSKLRATPGHPLATLLDKLGKLGDSPLLTTNYDCLLEDATGRFTLGLEDVLKSQRWHRMDPLNHPNPIATHHPMYIFHLHGLFYDDPEHRFVLTNSEYFATIDDFLIALKPILIDTEMGSGGVTVSTPPFPPLAKSDRPVASDRPMTPTALLSQTADDRGRSAIVTNVSSIMKSQVEADRLDKPLSNIRLVTPSPKGNRRGSRSPRVSMESVPAFHRSMIFIGVGGTLQDVHFSALFASLHEHNIFLAANGLPPVKHFALVKQSELDSVMNFTFSDSLGRKIESWEIICPVVYGENFSDLVPFLEGVLENLEEVLAREELSAMNMV